jgi:hypothetical protein
MASDKNSKAYKGLLPAFTDDVMFAGMAAMGGFVACSCNLHSERTKN